MRNTKFNFQPHTWEVIQKLQQRLTQTGEYPTLGHFYREIEILKFPHLDMARPGYLE